MRLHAAQFGGAANSNPAARASCWPAAAIADRPARNIPIDRARIDRARWHWHCADDAPPPPPAAACKCSLAMWSSTDELHYTPPETALLRDIPTVGCTPPSSKAAGADRSHACIDVGAENWMELIHKKKKRTGWSSGSLASTLKAHRGDVLRRKEIAS